MWNELFREHELASKIFNSGILLLALLALRFAAVRMIQRWKMSPAHTRRWIVTARNVALVVGLLGLLFIWGENLKTFAVSLIAIAAALVLATKELILCILGGIMRASTGTFSIGDRIEIQGLRGDVIDVSMMTTTLYEVGPGKDVHQFTGRVLVIPNSLMLTSSLVNETATGEYTLHTFKLPFKKGESWKEEIDKVLKACNEICAPFLEGAKRQFERSARKEGLEAPSVEPRISLAFPEPERVDLVVRVPVPSRRKGRIEQAILARYCGLARET